MLAIWSSKLREVDLRVPDGDLSAMLLDGTKPSTFVRDAIMALARINLETDDVVMVAGGIL